MSKTLAEQLVEVLPKEWEAFELVDTSEISCVDFKFSLDEPDDYGDNAVFINWALDELAKKDKSVALGTNERDGGWVVLLDTGEWEFPYPTKTLALAHALVAISSGEDND